MTGATRRRGRPPKSDDPATRDRLLDAAADACVEGGFDAVTVAQVAERAGVTASAVYNHFTDKNELLYTAGRLAIGRLGAHIAPTGDPARSAHDTAAAFLHPSFRAGRRLILELHMAGTRHPELAAHLADWHREFAALSGDRAAGTREPGGQGSGADPSVPTVTAFFLLLLGLCHLDDLTSLGADPEALQERVDRLVDALYGAGATTRD